MEEVFIPRRIGIFGGSFNPPHRGHIDIALRVYECAELDEVLFVVAKDPPHKSIASSVSAEERLRLTRAAIEGVPGFAVSDIELRREGKSYTVDTLRALKETYHSAELFLIVGADMLKTLPTWREPEGILSLASVIACDRPNSLLDMERAADTLRRDYGAKVLVTGLTGLDISSTAVREAVRDALPIAKLVPPAVERMIYEDGLYQEEDILSIEAELKRTLKSARYIHTIGVMRESIELAARFGVDGKRARLAGLLHDAAKLGHDEILSLAEKYGVVPDEYELKNPGLLHGKVGAELARDKFGIRDEGVLAAIRQHTVCSKDMDDLALVVYLADKLEPNRSYEAVGGLRRELDRGLYHAALASMEQVVSHLNELKLDIQPNIYETIENLKNKIRREEIGKDS